MYSPRKKLDIPEDFKFPFTPYKIQQNLMQSLYDVIENKQIGIFESPTGTGKSLTLTCGALKWLEDHNKLVRNEISEKLEELKSEIKDFETNGEKCKNWIEAQSNNLRKKDEFLSLKKIKSEIQEYDMKIERLKSKFKKKKELFNFKYTEAEELSKNQLHENLDEDLLLQDLDDSDNNSDGECDEDEYRDVKIYYCSRTHSQLSQVIHEIKRTVYGKHIRCVPLASRQNLCINSSVRQLSSLSAMNECCLDMQKSNSKTTSKDNEGCTQKKSRIKQQSTNCPYKNNALIEELCNNSLIDIHDIEDLVQAGRLIKACPYYSARISQKDAQIILLPYQILLHKKTRLQSGIDLRNSVVIVDEAHNLLDTISTIYSTEISLCQLKTALIQLNAYKQRYSNRFSAKNLLKINQLIFITKRLIKMLLLLSANENFSSSRILKTYELLHEGEFFNLNLREILLFCEKSRLAKKVNGLAQRQPEKIVDSSNSENTENLLKRLHEQVKSNKVEIKNELQNRQKGEQKQVKKESEVKIHEKTSAPVMRPLLTFLESLTECPNDSIILLNYDKDDKKTKLKFILLNPAGHFQEIINECRSIIIAGGTMQPTNEFLEQLFKSCQNRVRQHFYGHVVSSESVLPFIVQKGPSSKKFLFNFTNRYDVEVLNELGKTLDIACNIIPAGIVCFFGSYDYLEHVYTHLSKQGILNKIENKKFIFREPRSKLDGKEQTIEKILDDYGNAIKCNERNGAILFSVVGGKLSEGLNFSDSLGRCVILIGMPYPSKNSPELCEKINYLNKNLGNGAGNEYYENLCMKAVNQCIGRAIRHIEDYACVLLLDERYSNDKIKKKLPKWISNNLKTSKTFNEIQNSIMKFFNNKY